MSKETLSMRAAKKILDESSAAVIKFESKIISNGEEFEEKLSKIWEDEYAVSFIKDFWSKMQGLIETTDSNYNKYATTIKEIAIAYAKAGGMQPIIPLETIISKNVGAKAATTIGKVQDHFPFSDEFGFINIETGPTECSDLLDEALDKLTKIGGEVAENLDKINAFGNQEVKNNIEGFFKAILQNTITVYTLIKKGSYQRIYNAANTYRKTGESASNAMPTITETSDDFLEGKNIINQ